MKELISVQICVGTYSYVMGGAELMNLEERLPSHLRDKVKISGVIHIDGLDEESQNPPFASVNGRVICRANDKKIIEAIEEELLK